MGFSPLADMSKRIPHGNRQSKRKSKISGFTIHHHAGVNAMREATNPKREVSANYWISNEGDIIPQIDETMRPFTTGHAKYPAGAASDHRNITVEVSNSPAGVKNKTWAISDAARTSLEKLIADVFRRHNLGPVRRGRNAGVAVHQDFVSTSCPGPWIMARLDSIIANAERIRSGGAIARPKPVTPTTPKPTTPTKEEGILDMDEKKLAKLINDQTRTAMISVLQDKDRYSEYTDEHRDGKRDTRSLVDILFATHANAVGANHNVAAVAKKSGVPVDQIVSELLAGITPVIRELLKERKVDFSVDEFLDGLATRLKE